MTYHEIEGTWEEVLTHAPDLAGHRVKVTVVDKGTDREQQTTDALKEQRLKALREFAAAPLSDVPPLSDEAMRRESIYADHD